MCWLQSDDSSRLKTVIISIIIICIYQSYVRLLHFCCNPSCPWGTFKDFQISRRPLRGEEEGAELNSSAVTGAGICCCCCCFPLFCSFKWRLDQNSLTEEHKKSIGSALSLTVKHFLLSLNTQMFFETSKRIKTLRFFSSSVAGLLCEQIWLVRLQTEAGTGLRARGQIPGSVQKRPDTSGR